MGRYYSGDIEGKFWFGVQSSNSADRFGVQGFQPEYIEYVFCQEDKDSVERELKKIEKSLGDQLKLMEDFFINPAPYTNDMLIGSGINVSKLSDYADYELGKKILECLNNNGNCEFTAEL
jgi:hypothetical protein